MSEQLESRREADDKRLARLRAAAVQADSAPSLLAVARWLRKRLPGDERFGDPLSTGGDAPPEVIARQVAALGRADRPSVAHELGLGTLQVWQSLSEKAGRGRGTDEVALLFTDLVGFSSWALEVGDEAAIRLLREVGYALDEAIAAHDGAVVKHLGDGAMAVFERSSDAVNAALDARDAMEAIDVEGHRPRLRSGVHAGKPRKIGGDYLGVDVNIAARVVEAAKPQQVLVSQASCESLDPQAFGVGKAKRLRAQGAPKEFRVSEVERSSA
ncbi:MAG TPA: adenylate/guanylate cyclase domain-containing protein [Thermoleophilaceae bacterium]|nr:adenylate/guanylate cyclase domain-containing protein [Thermoleophilaceae bacterium]